MRLCIMYYSEEINKCFLHQLHMFKLIAVSGTKNNNKTRLFTTVKGDKTPVQGVYVIPQENITVR
jgi:hypothetical protein